MCYVCGLKIPYWSKSEVFVCQVSPCPRNVREMFASCPGKNMNYLGFSKSADIWRIGADRCEHLWFLGVSLSLRTFGGQVRIGADRCGHRTSLVPGCLSRSVDIWRTGADIWRTLVSLLDLIQKYWKYLHEIILVRIVRYLRLTKN